LPLPRRSPGLRTAFDALLAVRLSFPLSARLFSAFACSMDLAAFSDRWWIALGAAGYAAGFLYGITSLVGRRRHSRLAMYLLMSGGFLLQTIGLYRRGLATGGCPLGNTFELVQFLVWSCVLLYLVVGPAFRMSLLGFFSAGLAGALGLLSLGIGAWDSPVRVRYFGPNPWIETHAALALFSYGVFALLALTALMYLLQHYSLRAKRTTRIAPFLPSIVDLDQINTRLLACGVALLTTSLALGAHYFISEPDAVPIAKLVATVFVWAAYGLALLARWRQRLLGRPLAWVCLVLFALTLLSLGPINQRHAASSPFPRPAVEAAPATAPILAAAPAARAPVFPVCGNDPHG
jgi:HemX protein